MHPFWIRTRAARVRGREGEAVSPVGHTDKLKAGSGGAVSPTGSGAQGKGAAGEAVSPTGHTANAAGLPISHTAKGEGGRGEAVSPTGHTAMGDAVSPTGKGTAGKRAQRAGPRGEGALPHLAPPAAGGKEFGTQLASKELASIAADHITEGEAVSCRSVFPWGHVPKSVAQVFVRGIDSGVNWGRSRAVR
jgi:hypothetical protein